MDTYELSWNNMAAILCLDSDHALEPNPQPIRGTPGLTVYIPYDDYLKFLGTLPKEFPYLYRKPAEALAEPVKSYMFDVARAVGKELYYCSRYGMSPTHFRHKYNGEVEPRPEHNWQSSSEAFQAYLEKHGFPVPVNDRTRLEWAYACSLAECSRAFPTTMWNL